MNLAIIPARGGSKRIPLKNIKNFLGKPIIAYSIQAALESKLFDEVMVSTDDETIAKIAVEYGAKVPFKRSEENAGDQASTEDVLKEVLKNYGNNGMKFDYACCLYPCAPFITYEKLRQAYSKLSTEHIDTVFTVLKYGSPIQRALKLENGRIKMFYPANYYKRTQDLEPAYHDAGQFYFFSTEKFLKNGELWTDNTTAIIINDLEAQDIDNESDWKMAELKYSLLHNNAGK